MKGAPGICLIHEIHEGLRIKNYSKHELVLTPHMLKYAIYGDLSASWINKYINQNIANVMGHSHPRYLFVLHILAVMQYEHRWQL